MSEGDNLAPHNDRMLRMARAAKARGRYDLSPKQIIMARHMANAGAELQEVLDALGWKCDRCFGRRKLGKSYGIWPLVHTGNAHRGVRTTLPWAQERQPEHIQYRPKRVAP